MPVSNFPNGFNDGVTIRDMPVNLAHPGKVFFVCNGPTPMATNGVGGAPGNKGTYQAPFNSLTVALSDGNCVSGRGDVIMIGPNHTETISSSTALTLNKAGVCIVGLGSGSSRPTFTLDTANTSTINVSADNISIANCLFVANFLSIAACFSLTTAKGFTLSNCEFRDTSAILNFARIVSTSTTDNAADNLSIEKCNWYGLGTTANSCVIRCQGNLRTLNTSDCYFAHAATTDAGYMPISTGKLVTNLKCTNNVFNLVSSSGATTGLLITTNGTTNSGILKNNFTQSLDATTPILVTASSGFRYNNNVHASASDTSGSVIP